MPWLLSRPIVILAALAAILGALNIWQLYRAGKASEACKTLLAEANSRYLAAAAERDAKSVSIGREAVADAEDEVADANADNNERIDRVRTIIREVPIPANCPVSLPERVQDDLRDATAAANR